MPRREKAKAKEKKHRSSGSFISEENQALTTEEVAERIVNTLHNLGKQRFAVSPFSEHLSRWLVNLKDILSEFEARACVDDQFAKERAKILSNVELDLEKIRNREASSGEAFKILSDNRILLKRAEQDYAAKTKEMEERSNSEIKRLTGNVNAIKEELDRTARMRAGIFRGISKEAKARKETEASQRLNAAQNELTSVTQQLIAEQEKLRDEHLRKKQAMTEEIRDREKEVESQEIDASLETRRVACEALTNTVISFLRRKGLSQH
jgi:hypothetical protein